MLSSNAALSHGLYLDAGILEALGNIVLIDEIENGPHHSVLDPVGGVGSDTTEQLAVQAGLLIKMRFSRWEQDKA